MESTSQYNLEEKAIAKTISTQTQYIKSMVSSALLYVKISFFKKNTARETPGNIINIKKNVKAIQASSKGDGEHKREGKTCPTQEKRKTICTNWEDYEKLLVCQGKSWWAWREASWMNPIFQLLKDGPLLLKMRPFLCFQISQAPNIKNFMKRGFRYMSKLVTAFFEYTGKK
jgi:hypothetical protein